MNLCSVSYFLCGRVAFACALKSTHLHPYICAVVFSPQHIGYVYTQGASDAILETLPEVIVDATHIRLGQDNTCPICLSEMAIGESARVLRCSHIFHKQVRPCAPFLYTCRCA
jgi:hypothetical protein